MNGPGVKNKRWSALAAAAAWALAAGLPWGRAWAGATAQVGAQVGAGGGEGLGASIGSGAGREGAADDGGPIAFRVAKVITMDAGDRVINNAVVLVRDGKIAAVGRAREVEIPEGARVVEMPDHWLMPGLVECHNHTAGSLSDLNDSVYLTNPGLNTLSTIIAGGFEAEMAQAGGVTTALLIPGSGTNISGFGTIAKFAGETIDEIVVKSPGSLKIAQAGNPERYWYRVGRTMMNYNTRRTLEEARDYHLAWTAYEAGDSAEEPEYSPIFEDFRGLFRREYIASMHTQQYQVLMTTVLMIARGLNIRTVHDHSTFDAWKAAPLVLETGEDNIITINGPRQFHFDRSQRKLMGNAARWWQGGIRKLGINTDAPVVPQESLIHQAAMAVWFGWKPYEALAGLTRVPAEALMMDARVGSIEVGKDADFALWTGDPLDARSAAEMTVINGSVVYDASRDGRRY